MIAIQQPLDSFPRLFPIETRLWASIHYTEMLDQFSMSVKDADLPIVCPSPSRITRFSLRIRSISSKALRTTLAGLTVWVFGPDFL